MHSNLDSCVALDREFVDIETDNRVEGLNALASCLYGKDATTRSFRYAPSIVCRSEISLLGFSHPRFAIRAYLSSEQEGCLGWVSLRRLAELAKQSVVWHEATQLEPNQESIFTRHPSFVADSFFRVPQTLSTDHHVLVCNFSHEYAEPDFEAAPFMQSVPLGGGLCAQACAWMASAIVYNHADTMHGPSEISLLVALAENLADISEISINGLSFLQLNKYFSTISLAGPVCMFDASVHYERKMAEHVVRSYVFSGIPVIAAVDLGRLRGVAGLGSIVLGHSIYASNKVPPAFLPRPAYKLQHHAVLVSGFGCVSGDCVLHDPSSVPFLKVSFSDLIDRRTYGEFDAPDVEEPPLNDLSLSKQFRCQPVVPSRVKCHLYLNSAMEDGLDSPQIGLGNLFDSLAIRDDFWAERSVFVDSEKKPMPYFVDTEMRLLNCGEFASTGFANDNVAEYSVPVPSAVLNEMKTRGDRWVWLQTCLMPAEPQVVRGWMLWDAENEVDADIDIREDAPKDVASIARKLLLAFIVEGPAVGDADTLTPDLQKKTFLPQDSTKQLKSDVRNKCTIIPRVLSSCFPSATIEGLASLRELILRKGFLLHDGILPVEFYFAMASDCKALFEEFPKAMSVTEVFSHARGTKRFHEWVVDLCVKLSAAKLRVEGFASFIPSISSSDHDTRRTAANALAALQEAAELFRKNGHPVNFIEFVGGSIFGQLRQVQASSSSFGSKPVDIRCQILNRRRAIENIALALRNALDIYRQDCHGAETCFLAELEPGPGFVLNTFDALHSLNYELRDGFPLRFNCDVPHFRMSGEHILARQQSDLFSNVHLAGHGKAHIGDCPLLDLDADSGRLVKSILDASSDGPRGLSIEFEAAPSVEAVWQSFLTASSFEVAQS